MAQAPPLVQTPVKSGVSVEPYVPPDHTVGEQWPGAERPTKQTTLFSSRFLTPTAAAARRGGLAKRPRPPASSSSSSSNEKQPSDDDEASSDDWDLVGSSAGT